MSETAIVTIPTPPVMNSDDFEGLDDLYADRAQLPPVSLSVRHAVSRGSGSQADVAMK